MLFNSYIFVFVFLPVALVGWWQLRNTAARLIFLTLMSYVFYGWWDWRFLPLMIASTTVDYIAGFKIAGTEDAKLRKRWLVCSLTFNLVALGVFKYYGFFATSVNQVAERMGATPMIPVLNVVLPIGISFYTFNSMSYTIDVYRRIVRPARSLLHFSAFVAMFPHLIAGPIVRYADIEDQFQLFKKRLSWEEAGIGIQFFVLGMAKKLFIADQLAGTVETYFASPMGHGAAMAWLGVLGYTFQLYFDFSAYSDMAVGLAHFLGIQFPKNFNSPYKAVNIADFWRRWHISLSTWLRDYLFIPLGGSRKGQWQTIRNLTITMFLGGLWHGASWTFVVWGLYHGFLLAAHTVCKEKGWTPRSEWFSRVVTFCAVMVGWVFFRSPSFGEARLILGQMMGASGIGTIDVSVLFVAALAAAGLIAVLAPNTWEIEMKPRWSYAVALGGAMVALIMIMEKQSPFLYFQF